jgi:hypothetical protein
MNEISISLPHGKFTVEVASLLQEHNLSIHNVSAVVHCQLHESETNHNNDINACVMHID